MMATFDHELTLLDFTTTKNEYGDTVTELVETIVLCDLESVTRSEHYAAAQSGLRPEFVFIVNKHDYSGQKEVKFEGKRYNVLRTYAPKKQKDIGLFDTIELICQGVSGDG